MRLSRKWVRRLVIASAVAFVGLGGVLAGGYRFVMSVEDQKLNVDAESRRFRVEPGDSFARLARELTSRGMITSEPLRLRLYGRLTGRASGIQAGEYRIEPGMDLGELLVAMENGDVMHYTLTIIEGWRFQRLLQALRSHEAVTTAIADRDPERIMTAIGADGEHPEGLFLPQTYQFPRGTTDKALLERAYQAMDRVLLEAWSNRKKGLPLNSPYEALILASIIEKETSLARERHRIAGVFIRRLKRGMRLQTDPTVIYGLGDSFDGDLRRRHLRQDTPYNTYTRHGLPPSPIALPGAAAIRAAVDPAEGDALYFVAKDDGSHYFSDTLEEHNRAVERYQR